MTDNGLRVLITGIAGGLAGELARRLEQDERVSYVGGVDLHEPVTPLRRTEFIRADLRNPLVAKVVESTRVDVIVHLAITAEPGEAGGRQRMKELNVIGTMQLLGAAQHAPRLRKFVLKSTTAVYGSSYSDPALFREDSAPGVPLRHGYSKDAVEVESYGRAFGRRRRDVTMTILRFANFIGPDADSPLIRYLCLPVVPTVLGFDPRVQLCHTDDAAAVLHEAVTSDHPGIFNIAGPGIVYLSQAIRMAGKPSVPVPQPFVNGLAGMVRRTGLVDFSPEQLRYLLFGRVGDITRMRTDFGYEPRYGTKEALADFLDSGRVIPLVEHETIAHWEQRLHDLFGSRRERVS